MGDYSWLCSAILNGFFMLIVCFINKLSNEKRDKFEVEKYKNQVYKKAKEFLSKYYIGLDSTNFLDEYFESDNDEDAIFEKNNSRLILKGSLRECIIKIINEYDNKNYYTNCITQHDYDTQKPRSINLWTEIFLLSNDERNEVLRLLKEEIPKKDVKFKFN